MLRYADATQLPLLGICRGAQLMNVFAGGTLHQSLDMYIETPQAWTVLPQKEIQICQNTELRRLFGERCRVNSLHRQAIARPGAELEISAYDSDRIVQGIERSSPYWLGVQWHPEYLPQSAEQQRLFRALVDRGHAAGAARVAGVAHEPVRLVRGGGGSRMLTVNSGIDHTGAMTYLTPATRMLGYEPRDMVGVRAAPGDAVRLLAGKDLHDPIPSPPGGPCQPVTPESRVDASRITPRPGRAAIGKGTFGPCRRT